MFKRIILAAAVLSLAACGATHSERVASVEKRSKEQIHVVCAQSGETVFDEKVMEVYVLNSGIHGYTVDGAEFFVGGATCKWKATPNVSKN